jgi:hypothetical protein
MGVSPTKALKRSLNLERDMATSRARLSNVQARAGSRCMRVMARAIGGSDKARHQPASGEPTARSRCSRRMLTSSNSPMRQADRRQPGRWARVSVTNASMVPARLSAIGSSCARTWIKGGRMRSTECRQ